MSKYTNRIPHKGHHDWALILGSSSGFGGATALALAEAGFHIFGVHLDRQATIKNVEAIIGGIEERGCKAVFFNMNAADPIKREETLDEIQERFLSDKRAHVRILFHSLAFGTLRPFISVSPEEMITKAQMEMTMDVMAHSLVYWTQGLIKRGLMEDGGRIIAMTSEGGSIALPFYGAVSSAKAALESHIRQLAAELAPRGITVNGLLAGITDTPALRKIPGARNMIKVARRKNPFGRLTRPEDVAEAVVLLVMEGAHFISGNIIGVDGAESKVAFVGQKYPHESGAGTR
ncbi:MAG: SDR family oxidoreductase [Chlorobi bacterium]|nr:SDR family oxidoreductase [Chlorobiota bacterium]